MKKLLLTSLLIVPALGCHSISIPTPIGIAKAWSFGTKTVWSELAFGTNGTLVVKGYNSDQVTALQSAFTAGMAASKAAVIP